MNKLITCVAWHKKRLNNNFLSFQILISARIFYRSYFFISLLASLLNGKLNVGRYKKT